jgi:hypothetical protein
MTYDLEEIELYDKYIIDMKRYIKRKYKFSFKNKELHISKEGDQYVFGVLQEVDFGDYIEERITKMFYVQPYDKWKIQLIREQKINELLK